MITLDCCAWCMNRAVLDVKRNVVVASNGSEHAPVEITDGGLVTWLCVHCAYETSLYVTELDQTTGDDTTERQLPRAAMLNGKRVRVLAYEGDGYFTVLTRRDERKLVKRDRLTFVKGRV